MNGSEMVRAIHISGSAEDSLRLSIVVELSASAPACCVSADRAFVEFRRDGHAVRADFELQERKDGHRFAASLRLPSPGVYVYRLVAQVLGHHIIREGVYHAQP
jgi:hypothetical protein